MSLKSKRNLFYASQYSENQVFCDIPDAHIAFEFIFKFDLDFTVEQLFVAFT